jgi:hypothetical protein
MWVSAFIAELELQFVHEGYSNELHLCVPLPFLPHPPPPETTKGLDVDIKSAVVQ